MAVVNHQLLTSVLIIFILLKVGISLPKRNFFETRGGQIIDYVGDTVQLTGINVFGFETDSFVPRGLHVRGYKEMLDQIRELKFNTIRLPYSSEMLDARLTPSMETTLSKHIDWGKNKDLIGLTPLEIMDKFIDYCGEINLRVVLDRHSCKANNFANENLWYIKDDSYCTSEKWMSDWEMLALKYKGNPAVIGADLFNEPKNLDGKDKPTWGAEDSPIPLTDWNKAAKICGNRVLSVNSDWLIFVEGIAEHNDEFYWWGGNLLGWAEHPIELSIPNKVVASAHVYPPSVYDQPWFNVTDFPENLFGIWRNFFGYLVEDKTVPLLIGEFGSFMGVEPTGGFQGYFKYFDWNRDKLWMTNFVKYLSGDFNGDGQIDVGAQEKGLSFTYFCWSPDSHDTGGILADDFKTVQSVKYNAIKDLLRPNDLLIISEDSNKEDSNSPSTVTIVESVFVLANIDRGFDDEFYYGEYGISLRQTVAQILNIPVKNVRLFSDGNQLITASTIPFETHPSYPAGTSLAIFNFQQLVEDAVKSNVFNTLFHEKLVANGVSSSHISNTNPHVKSTSLFVLEVSKPTASPTVEPPAAANSYSKEQDITLLVIIIFCTMIVITNIIVCVRYPKWVSICESKVTKYHRALLLAEEKKSIDPYELYQRSCKINEKIKMSDEVLMIV